MSLALLGARLLLAGVFATAGIAKLADREGSRRAVAEFGVPRRLAWLIGSALPLVELAAAGLLVPGASARFGALLAAVLLLAFSAAIALSLGRGRAPECRCFGQVHSAPVTWRAVARNLGLSGLAAAIAINNGAALDYTEALGAGLAIVLAALLLVARGAKRAEDVSLDFSEGLPIGADAPTFELRSREGDTVTLAALLARGKPVVLLFTDVNCGPCIALAPEVADWQRSLSDQLTIAVLERGGRGAGDEDEHGRGLVLFQQEEEVAQAYLAEGTPVAVLVGRDGKIASAVAPGSTAIRRLVGMDDVEPEPRHDPGLPRRAFLLRAAGAAMIVLAAPGRALGGIAGVRGKAACEPGTTPCGRGCCREGQKCIQRAFKSPRCVCPDPFFRDPCPGECRNTTVENDNCGDCGVECLPGWSCVGGNCRKRNVKQCRGGCTTGKAWCCEGQCKDLAKDLDNCGSCGARCTGGKKPTCCEGLCRDIKSDPRHCGGCFKPCATEEICYGGTCWSTCPKPLERCGNTCGNRKFDRCCGGRIFSKEQYPEAEYRCCNGKLVKPIKCGGKPACPGTCCNGKIVDTLNDPKHCGPSCKACGGGSNRCCNGKCVDISTSTEHCNGCGKPCKKFEVCRFHDGCICPLGAECAPPLPHP